MSYELTITPSRGTVILLTSGVEVEGNIMPTSVIGTKIVESRLTKFWTGQLAEFTVGPASGDGVIAFNNASFQNTTQITLKATTNTGGGFIIFGGQFSNHIQLFKSSNFEEYALFKVNSNNSSPSARTQVLDVTFISSTVSSYATGDDVVLGLAGKLSEVPYNYLATNSQPLTAIGTLKSINAILQTPESVIWSETPNNYFLTAAGGYDRVNNVEKAPADTSDVGLIYQVTKNGVLHQNFFVSLKYDAQQNQI